jgi:integrase
VALKIKRLSARTVATLDRSGRHSDGGGLYLSISRDGCTVRRRWVFLFRHRGKLREMGLGGASAVTLAQARELAAKWRAEVAAGRNPLESRKAERRAQRATPTFGELAEELYVAKSHEWRNAKVRKQWRTPLQIYAVRLLCMPVNEITTEDVLSVLQPIWTTKAETASRLRGRIEAVLDAARVRGFIGANEANPARWRGHLSHWLPKRRRLTKGHHAAMSFQEVPSFVSSLRKREAVAAAALEFLILTAARTSEVLGARWDEMDLRLKIWTVSAQRMKGGREHRVPLSERSVEILRIVEKARTGELVFPSTTADRPLSGMAMEMLLRRMRIEGATIHGFRSSFRDWVGDATQFPRELAEAALAHVAGDATERAYRRGDALARRNELMEAWAQFLERPMNENVLPLRATGTVR